MLGELERRLRVVPRMKTYWGCELCIPPYGKKMV